MSDHENMRLVATYHTALGDNFYVYADGGYAELQHIVAATGEHTVIYEGEYCEAIAEFAEQALADVAPGLTCPCGKLNTDCDHPDCPTGEAEAV